MGNGESLFKNFESGSQLDIFTNPVKCDAPNTEGVKIKYSDYNEKIVYDLTNKKSLNGYIELQEFIMEKLSGDYYKCEDFIITNPKILKILSDENVLPTVVKFEKLQRLSTQTILRFFPKLEYIAHYYNNIDDRLYFQEIVTFIKENIKIFSLLDKTISEGIIPNEVMPYYFKIGTKVYITESHKSEKIYYGAIIDNVSSNEISCNILALDRFGKYMRNKKIIKLKPKCYKVSELQSIINILPDDRESLTNNEIYQQLNQRGKNIDSLRGKINHMSYTGPIFNNNQITYYENKIRVISDFCNFIPLTDQEKYGDYDNYDKYDKDRKAPKIDNVKENELFTVIGIVRVFDLRKNIFIDVFYDYLTYVDYNQHAFDELVLDQKYKNFLNIAVSSHSNIKDKYQIDSISDKGNGLLFILSGPPGTGKTMTVESLADKNRLPLMTINFSTLGIRPDIVEKSLKYHLQLAEYWNAIVLFDEADIFLESRNNSLDVTRNAIVGIFLQYLEYHHGIVFITTNRKDCLDSAIVSRSILTIKYNNLDNTDNLIVWCNLLSNLTGDYQSLIDAIGHFLIDVTNGREIRNIIHTAVIISNGEQLNQNHLISALDLHQY